MRVAVEQVLSGTQGSGRLSGLRDGKGLGLGSRVILFPAQGKPELRVQCLDERGRAGHICNGKVSSPGHAYAFDRLGALYPDSCRVARSQQGQP